MSKTVTTPEARLSYPHLFTPTAMNEGEEKKYSCSLIFEKGADLKALKAAVLAAAQEEWGEDKAAKMIRAGKLRMPFRSDWADKGYPEDSTFINVRTTNPPGLIERYADPDTGGAVAITDPGRLYPGVVVMANLTAFSYDYMGNKGVSFALNHIQRRADGERLDGRTAAENVFDLEAASEADLGDLEAPQQEITESGDDRDDLSDLIG